MLKQADTSFQDLLKKSIEDCRKEIVNTVSGGVSLQLKQLKLEMNEKMSIMQENLDEV